MTPIMYSSVISLAADSEITFCGLKNSLEKFILYPEVQHHQHQDHH